MDAQQMFIEWVMNEIDLAHFCDRNKVMVTF